MTPGLGDWQIIIRAKPQMEAFARLQSLLDRTLVTPPCWPTEDYIRQELESSEIDAMFAEAEVSMWKHELDVVQGFMRMCKAAATAVTTRV